ncbi:unnamed protein product [Arctogadus glacialis]
MNTVLRLRQTKSFLNFIPSSLLPSSSPPSVMFQMKDRLKLTADSSSVQRLSEPPKEELHNSNQPSASNAHALVGGISLLASHCNTRSVSRAADRPTITAPRFITGHGP